MEISLENLKKYGLGISDNGDWLVFPCPRSPIVGEIYGDKSQAIAAEIVKCVNASIGLREALAEYEEYDCCHRALDNFGISSPDGCTCLHCRTKALLAELEEQPKGES